MTTSLKCATLALLIAGAAVAQTVPAEPAAPPTPPPDTAVQSEPVIAPADADTPAPRTPDADPGEGDRDMKDHPDDQTRPPPPSR